MTRGDVYDALRSWLHESPLNLCTTSSDTCDNGELAEALTDVVMEAGGPVEGLARARAADVARRHAELIAGRGG